MQQKYSQPLKSNLVMLYTQGMKVSSICSEYSIPRSTMYYWLTRHKVIKKTDSDSFTARDFYLLQKKMKRIETEYTILKEYECHLASPRKERLEAIARLDGNYSIHALCRTLNILCSTYYHYKLRSPSETMIEKEDAVCKPVIQRIFEETKGRLGAKKIRVLLEQNGYTISARRISRLMNEMGLVCISRKKTHQYNYSPAMKYRKNVLKRNFKTDQPNKVWVSDITNINLNFKPYYSFTSLICSLEKLLPIESRTAKIRV